MAEGKKSEDLALAGFYEAMEKSNAAKIADEILGGLLTLTMKVLTLTMVLTIPSHVNFEKSTIKRGILRP
jgi:hypothetical protein